VADKNTDATDASLQSVAENACRIDLADIEAIMDQNNEELVNVMRLNSLLRFLVIGESPATKCNGQCTNEDQGSCTWATRGERGEQATKPKNCRDTESNAIECDYSNAGKNAA